MIEAEAVSPEAYVKENGRFPVLESMCNESGDVVIVTGDNKGSFVRYTFTEIEKAYYVEKYSDHVDGQNERNRKARHYDRVKTIDAILENNKTCPEETLLQL